MKNSKYQILNTKHLSSKGFALIWALLISLVIIVLGFTMAILVVKELKISSNIDESSRAYMAAEAGMERALYEVKLQLDDNITWCPESVIQIPTSPSSPPNNLDSTTGAQLGYISRIEATCAPSRIITIQSRGISRGTTERKLETKLTLVAPDNINKFDSNPNFIAGSYYPFPSASIASRPIIVEQFDVTFGTLTTDDRTRLNSLSIGGELELLTAGLSNDTPGTTDFGFTVKIVRMRGNSQEVKFILTGTVNGVAIISNPNPAESLDYDRHIQNNTFRVKLEYSRQGNYTVIRGVILKRIVSAGAQERFECIGSTQKYVVYTGVNARGANPTYVKISNGTWVSDPYDSWIGISGWSSSLVKIDNMTFWGRD